MKRISRLFPVLALAAFTLAGCSDADNEPPVISDMFITPEAGVGMVCGTEEDNVISVNTGDSITISFTVSDNEELSQYKMDVHSNFECHGHAKVETSVWEVIDIVDIEGLSQQVNYVLNVPDSTTAGLYHFSIQVADFFGNSAKTEIFNVVVKNLEDTLPPVLSVSEPLADTLTITLSDTTASDSIRFVGSVTDNRDLELGGNGKLELRYWKTDSPNVFNLYSIQFVAGTGPSYDFDFTVTVPAILVEGLYVFQLRAFDGVNNPSNTQEFDVKID